MISDTSKLPDDPAELKKIIEKMNDNHRRYESEIDLLREQVRHLYDKLYGRKSEKSQGHNPQLPLFDIPEPDPDEKEEKTTEVSAHLRKKRGRKVLPDTLPRIEVVHDLPDEEKVCGCGAELTRIGEEVSEKLDIIPAIIQVIRHIRPKYSCKSCEGIEDSGPTVKIAPVAPQIIPKSLASGGLLAHILTAKFTDALPFYRQEKQFARLGADIGRATMCNWAMKVAEKCSPLLDLVEKRIRSGPLINIDETTVQVLHEPGRSPTTKSFMWIFRGETPHGTGLVYQYHQTRSGDAAAAFLKGYRGAVQTDGYRGYDFLDHKKDIVHLGCWAHARRKFKEADKARGKKAKKSGSVNVALKYIRNIYGIEKELKSKELTPEECVRFRKERAQPVLDDFEKWLRKKSTQVVPKSLLGKAVSYTLKQWHRLIQSVDVGEATPDNNLAENAIRPFVIGRKNWLFAGTPKGAQASAAIYSLIETAKANNLEPYKYLRFLFENLPFAGSEKDYEQLLPFNLTEKQLELPVGWSVV
jgi:transposase